MIKIQYVEHSDSTNRAVKEMATAGAHEGLVLWAGRQSAGRGQYGRAFCSPMGGLYFSVLLRPRCVLEETPLITLAAGLACRDMLAACCGLEAAIKWPNDLMVGGKKIAGILSEYCPAADHSMEQGSAAAAVVVGMGINVNNRLTDFAEEIQPIITTAQECGAASQELSRLVEVCVKALFARIEELHHTREYFFRQWRQADYLLNKQLTHEHNGILIRRGAGLGLDQYGRYRLRDEAGREHAIVGGQLRLDPGHPAPASRMKEQSNG